MVLTRAPSLGVFHHFFKSFSISSLITELAEVLKHKLLKLLKNLSRAEIQIHKGTFEILEDYKNYQEKERDLYKARLNLLYYFKVLKNVILLQNYLLMLYANCSDKKKQS